MSLSTAIYVDADACPVKAEIYRVAERYGLKVYVVANAYINVPRDPRVERVVVGDGFDAADDWIAERVGPDDIVVTADIPLADRCLKKGAAVIGSTGVPFTNSSIASSFPSRISSATQLRTWQASSSRLKLFSAAVTAETWIRISGQ